MIKHYLSLFLFFSALHLFLPADEAQATFDIEDAKSIEPYLHGINRRHDVFICASPKVALEIANKLNTYVKQAFAQCNPKDDKKTCEGKAAEYIKYIGNEIDKFLDDTVDKEECIYYAKGNRPIHYSNHIVYKADRIELNIPDGVTTEGVPQEGLSVLTVYYWYTLNPPEEDISRPSRKGYIVTFIKVDEPEVFFPETLFPEILFEDIDSASWPAAECVAVAIGLALEDELLTCQPADECIAVDLYPEQKSRVGTCTPERRQEMIEERLSQIERIEDIERSLRDF